MRLDTSDDLTEFRENVRAFIADHAPGVKTHAGVRSPDPELVPAIRAWIAQLYESQYLGRSWPAAYGGLDDTRPEPGFIVAEEIAKARTWGQIGAASLASSAILTFGTEEQKQRFLPRIRSGEDLWCQLFSEPEAGSDLAALRTRARREGDDYVIDGQKVWTTNGQHADVGYLLARTDPEASKTRGITAFALDMRSPGVDIRPLREITGTSDFNEVFLDGVRIRADRVIGEVNDGWRVAGASLAHERSGVAARSAELLNDLGALLATAARSHGDTGAALHDPATRAALGRLATRVKVADLMSKAIQSRIANGVDDPTDAAIVKIFYSDVNLELAEQAVTFQGVNGLFVEDDEDAVDNGYWQDAFLYARAFTIAGGANEVLRTMIAERRFGLPREPRWTAS